MSTKPVVPRQQADRDVRTTIEYYLPEAGGQVALGFIDALAAAYGHLSRHPKSGSARYAHELELPGLRSWVVKPYPYLVFYVEREDHVDVWRILHQERDIPAWMRAATDPTL